MQVILISLVLTLVEVYASPDPKCECQSFDGWNIMDVLNEFFTELDKPLKELEKKLFAENEIFNSKKFSSGGFRTDIKQQEICEKYGSLPRNCADIVKKKRRNGIFIIAVDSFIEKPFSVYCNESDQGDNWTVIKRRKEATSDFDHDWETYKEGFGDLKSDFFIGLDRLHALTTDENQELLIEYTDSDNVTKHAEYDHFAIGDENEKYNLKVLGAYSGNAGDYLRSSVGQKFSTKDNPNNQNGTNCAIDAREAWWYKDCPKSDSKGSNNTNQHPLGNKFGLKVTQMLIRPKRD